MGSLIQIGRTLDNPATAELFIVAGLVFLLVGGLGHVAITIQADRAERAVTGVLGLLLIGAGLVFLQPATANPPGPAPASTSGAAASLAPIAASAASTVKPNTVPTIAPPTATAPPSTVAATVAPGPTRAAGVSAADAASTPLPAATAPPTATAVPLPKCQTYPVRGFGLVYRSNSDVAFRLGCASSPEVGVPASQETFEHGLMLKPTNGQLIYVIRADGSWKSYPDTYQLGQALAAVGGAPANLLAPDRGFGKLWRDQADVHQALGWATGPEQSVQAAVEPFAAGQMIWTSNRQIYVLYADGAGRAFPDQYVDPTATPA